MSLNLLRSTPDHLARLRPLIDSICVIAGAPDLSVGVVHDHVIFHESYHGYRDVDKRLEVDRNTIFHIASLTKAMTATALGILVGDGLLEWTAPVHDILPEMARSTETHIAKLTVLDILSHRTGKAWADALYLQSNNHILLPKNQAIPIFDYLPQVEPVRSTFMYNNHAYNIAGLVIEKVSGMSWSEFVSRRLFKPLGMSRSFTHQPDDDNVAVPYNILSNGEPWQLPFCDVSSDTLMFAGQSVRSSMSDLLRYSQAYLQALSTITPVRTTDNSIKEPRMKSDKSLSSSYVPEHVERLSTGEQLPCNPIREISTIMWPYIARPTESILEQTHALGWNRTQLPGALDFGWNQHMLDQFPLLGQRYPGKLAIWHGGNMPGTTAAICLLPETGTAVIVLQNSLGLCDIADWICQLIIDAIFLGEPAQDYVLLTSKCVQKGVKRMEMVEQKLLQDQIAGTKPQSIEIYCGRYFNSIKNWFIDIKLNPEAKMLYLEFLGLDKERYYLKHYHYDTFTWNLTYDELVKRGQYIRDHEYYKLEFEADSVGEINCLRWKHDKSMPWEERFCKS
ncbi:beta-lactamase/transpeptidase-like protein [Xylariaceae sp. FL0255]|nr:beta-lactamase/transpeptidase-like protein [Xylariaceae sp. FL0255]